LDSDEHFIDKLTPDHADFVSKYWTCISNETTVVSKYFKHLLQVYDASAGIFKKSDPSYPISWLLYGDYGVLIHMCTLPEHRHKGLALAVTKKLFVHLVLKGITPVMDQSKPSALTEKYSQVVRYAIDRIWRDSVTGECY